jgi:predicted ATPase/class 3 adenylate cyclase
MRNLVPERIVVNLKNNKLRDEFDCFSMFVDISGFTSTTEALMKHGQEGAEVLSDILRYLFDTTVKAVYDHSGYVTKYAGDAFTAIFEVKGSERKTALNVLESALITNRFFKENKIFRSKFGDFEFGVKVGLGYGKTMCGIAGSGIEKSYFFSGSAVDLCAMAEHNAVKGDIWMSESVYKFISDVLIDPGTNNLYGLNFFKVTDVKPFSVKTVKYEAAQFDKELIYRLSGKLESEFPVGEFRDVISVFISFEGKVDLDDLMAKLYDLKETYGPSHPVIDFGDKGGNILLFFGAPVSYENNSFRALSLILKLVEFADGIFNIRAGLSKGVVYCGFNGSDLRNEFTCLGNTVNQSARFMMKADWGQILIDKELSSNENFISGHLADIQYKGREGLIPTFVLRSKAEIKDIFFKGSFVGREKEKEKFRKYLSPLTKGKNCGAIYVDGEAGIGKSRFTNQIRQEFTKDNGPVAGNINWFYFSCDEIIREPYNPFRYFFQRYFDFDENSDSLNSEKFENKLNRILSRIKSKDIRDNLQNNRDYLAYFMDLKVSNSDIMAEEPNERQNSIFLSLTYFFKTFCEYSALVFEVDNASYLDTDSLKLYSRLSMALNKCPFAIIFNCRHKDNGEKFDHGFVKKKRIGLNPLNKTEFRELVKDRLKLKAVPKETVSALDDKSRRNPLFLEQMVIYIRENKVLDSKNRIIDVSNLPNGINQIILARIDKLESNLKELLKTAACIGNEIHIDLLSYLFRNKYKNIGKYLVQLENEDIIILFTELSYLFKFGVIRDVIYDIQLKKTLREIHEQIGFSIEQLHEDSLEKYYPVLAYHFENAENKEKALNYHQKAGYHAKENYQNDKALYHFDKADRFISLKNGIAESDWIEKFEKLDKDEIRKHIEINIERFYFYYTFRQNIKMSSDLTAEVYELSSKLEDGYLLSKSLMNRSLIFANNGEYEKSNHDLNRAIGIQRDLKLFYESATTFASLGKNHMMAGEMSKALECFNTGLEQAGHIQDIKLRDKINAKIYGDMGIVYDYSGDLNEALRFYNKQLEITERLNLKIEKSTALGNIGVVYHISGDLEKARKFYEDKLKLSEQLGRKVDIAQILNNMGFLYKDLKVFSKAITFHKRSFSLSRELSDHNTMAGASVNMGHVYKLTNDFDKAEQSYLSGINIAQNYGFKHLYAEGMIELADMYFQSGDIKSANQYVEQGLKVAKDIGFSEYIEKGTGVFDKINSK